MWLFMKKKLIIGSRSSDLALWQTNYVKSQIEKYNGNIEVLTKLVNTKGDKILDVALSKIGDKGLFTKELEVELLRGNIDIAVHSLKDLQTLIPEGLKLAAVTKRHDVEDVLIAKKPGTTIRTLPQEGTVATGSLRRRSQLKYIRPDINIIDLRGNVLTRIQKFLDSDWDAIILARAGVERLKLGRYISSFINVDDIIPAVGQGALGIEIKKDNKFADKVVQSIHHENTSIAVTAERTLLKALEGGCQVPIGAYAEVKANGLYLSATVGSIDGKTQYKKKIRGSRKEPQKAGEILANELLKAGAKKILDEIYITSRSE
jgi:hydroxymethylbilane synthase